MRLLIGDLPCFLREELPLLQQGFSLSKKLVWLV